MTVITSQDTRNICIAGHGTTGKTTLTEALLMHMGTVSRLGLVENGNTISDFTDEEVEKGISISTAVCSAEYKNKLVTIIDTPGYFDFSGEMVNALPFAESVIVTVRGTSGLDVGSENAFNQARQYNKSISFFINEADKENLNVDEVIEAIQSDLGIMLAPLSLPANVGPNISGIVNILEGKLVKYVDGKRVGEEDLSGEHARKAEEYKLKLMESIAESDEALMEKYFEIGELTLDEMKIGLKKAFSQGTIFPLFFGVPNVAMGTDILLEAIYDFFPSPIEKQRFDTPHGSLEFDSSKPLIASVFKVCLIPQFGEMYLTKVIQGTLNENVDIYNAKESVTIKAGQLFFPNGKERLKASKIEAGQIVALVKLKTTKTGDILVADKSVKVPDFDLMEWPNAIVRGAFTGSSKEDTDKIATGLKKLNIEDSTFKFKSDPELKQLLVDGMGRLHLETLALKLKNRQKLVVSIEEPRVPYRETITGTSDVRYRHKKQTGGAGQFGEVAIKLEPTKEEFEFVNGIVGGVISGRFVPAVEKGVREVMVEGVLVGSKVIGCKVTLYDGKEHQVDSNEMAFKVAGSHAFKKALLEAKPILLEPIYDVEVTAPAEYAGTVMGDISSRRGQPSGMDARGKYQVLKAKIPLKELHDYSTQLRSMTTGRGTYSIRFSHYDPVPFDLQKQLVATHESSHIDAAGK